MAKRLIGFLAAFVLVCAWPSLAQAQTGTGLFNPRPTSKKQDALRIMQSRVGKETGFRLEEDRIQDSSVAYLTASDEFGNATLEAVILLDSTDPELDKHCPMIFITNGMEGRSGVYQLGDEVGSMDFKIIFLEADSPMMKILQKQYDGHRSIVYYL